MTTNAFSEHSIQETASQKIHEDQIGQYSLRKILGIWALVTLPMALLAWVVAPAIIPYSPLHPGITFWVLMIISAKDNGRDYTEQEYQTLYQVAHVVAQAIEQDRKTQTR